jgi:PAS domain S-box-containing protein
MSIEMRKSGIDVVGDIPWGTHFCLFYETKDDILDAVVPYCKVGLENHEYCLWVVSEPLRVEDAWYALAQAIPDLDRYVSDRSMEIVSAHDWYLHGGVFDLKRVTDSWHEKLAGALARGYAGVRVTGDTAWLEKKDWKDFCEYEDSLNEAVANQRLAVLCTYRLASCGAFEILDVVRTHQFAVTKRQRSWDVIETAGLKQAKTEIMRLNEDLEQRVEERTSELTVLNGELTKEILERERAESALRRSEAFLAEAQTLTHTGSWALSTATRRIVHWSPEHFRLFGFDPHGGLPSLEAALERVHPDDRRRVVDAFERGIRDGAEHNVECRLVLPDGTVKCIHVVGHPVFNASGDLEAHVGTAMDVTERKRAEEVLEALAGRLIQAQEEERSRIGRELHDHISQTLGVLTIKIDQLSANADLTAGIAAPLDELRRDTSDIADDVRRLSHRLHSSTLDYLGLVPALQKLVAEFSERHGIATALAYASLPPSLPSEVALCLFRVAEESLTNVARHSKARSARVHVAGAPDGIHLTVEDAGSGFDVTSPDSRAGLGFISMQERLRVLHGTIQVDSAPSRGTRIDAWVPAMMRASARHEVAHGSDTV